jgi:Na+/melibiose symporter-like transporter
MASHKLKRSVILSFGFGQLSEAVKNSGFNVFLLFYYNQVLGISATLSSIALAIALLFDAVSDPIVGSFSDKLRTPYGRRHPLILIAALPLAISFYCLFNPPSGFSEAAYFAWLLIFAILVRGSLTLYHVPHLALGAELTEDYDQRSLLYSMSTFFGFLGGALVVPVSYTLFFPTTEAFNPALLNQEAYQPWALSAGAVMIVSILVCVLGTWREVPRLVARSDALPENRMHLSELFAEFKAAFANRSFRAIFFGMMLSTMVLAVEGVFNPFMGFHFWGLTTEQLRWIPLAQLVGLCLSVLLLPPITRWLDKKMTLIVSALVVIVNINIPIVLSLTGVAWFPDKGSEALLALLIVSGLVTAALAPIIFATLNSMFADIADEHELDTGYRREGVIFAARSFAVKATGSLGLIFGGALLDVIAFPRGALMGSVDSEIVWLLGFIAGPATSVFTILGVLLYARYSINRDRHAQIKGLLAERRSRSSDAAKSNQVREPSIEAGISDEGIKP